MTLKNRNALPVRPGQRKSAETRQRILTAAREVFSNYPYSVASIRMIADKAGVRHPLLLHYFGSKVRLFGEATWVLETEVFTEDPMLPLAPLKLLPKDRVFPAFLEGIVINAFRNRDAFKAILLNLGEAAGMENLPGVIRLNQIREKSLDLIWEYLLPESPDPDANLFFFIHLLTVSHLVGAAGFHRISLGIDSEKEYENWVRGTVRLVFEPLLTTLSQGPVGRLTLPDIRVSDLADKSEEGNPGTGVKQTRGEETRQRILAAARKVFSAHPYNAASIRMIGQAGKFDFTRIRHFYPAKADLFGAATRDVFEDLEAAAEQWREGLQGRPADEVFISYLRRALITCFENREAMGFLMHNIAQFGRFEDLPGFDEIARFHEKLLAMIGELIPPEAPAPAMSRWLYTIITMVYTFTGAPDYPAALMGLLPNSPEYRKAIFETLVLAFMPSFVAITGTTPSH